MVEPTRQPETVVCRNGPIEGLRIETLKCLEDSRGWLIELFRHDQIDECDYPMMAYVNQTLPGASRGPHEHRNQTDCFAFVGPSDFKLYLWDTRRDSPTFGHRQTLIVGQSNRCIVMVPPGIVHGYKNVSNIAGLVFNAPNRLYAGWGKKEPVDEIRHEDRDGNPFVLD